MSETIRIIKRSDTHADVLLAVGLADALTNCDAFRPPEIRITETPEAFEVSASGPVVDTVRQQLRHIPGYRYIVEKDDQAPLGAEVCRYEQERERAKRYQEIAAALRKEGKPTDEIRELLAQEMPTSSWRAEQSVRLLQGHHMANKLIRQILELGEGRLREQFAGGLERMAQGLPSGLTWKTEQVQVFNPSAAKGYARLKPDSTDRNDGTSGSWGDPLIAWLQIRGFYQVSTPFYLGSKGEHIRIFTPIPADISLAALQQISSGLPQAGVRSTSEPKLDCLAIIALTRILVEGCEENQARKTPPLPGLKLRSRRPSSAISGVHITHYQSLGQSRAVGALQRLAIPGWFAIQDPDDVRDWLEILGEHRAALLSLNDERSDEIGVLVAYRRFLQSADVDGTETAAGALLDFLGQYGCFLIRAREQRRRARQFTTVHVRRILMGISRSYTDILDDPGFTAVATAVRRATVSAKGQKALKQPHRRDIRYDLLHDLRRKRALAGDEFMEAVAEFVSQYNSENAMRREHGLSKITPANVTTDEFRAFAALLDVFGAPKVGALLCAFGTCRSLYEPASDAESPDSEAGDPGEIHTDTDSE